jgi:hypothetical protein
VTVAYRYLKKQYKFPEIASRAAAAAAEAAARLQRHQQLLLQRYTAFKADFPQQRGQMDSLIQQIQECFKLLNEQPQQQQQQQQQVPQSPQPLPQQPEEQLGEQAAAEQQQRDVEPAALPPPPAAAAAAGEAAMDEQWEDVPAAAAAGGGGDTDIDDGVTLADDDIDELIGDYHTGGNRYHNTGQPRLAFHCSFKAFMSLAACDTTRQGPKLLQPHCCNCFIRVEFPNRPFGV